MNINPIEQFRQAIQSAGLTPPDVIEADGKLRRFASNGKRGDDAGWYVLYGDGIPAGIFGDWRTGISQTWRADIGRKLTSEEAAANRERARAMRQVREAEEAKGHAEVATRAECIWNAAQPANASHPYLTRKSIQPHGTRVDDAGRLLVPLFDTSGRLWNLERITPEKPADGGPDKKGLYQGKRTGCFYLIGNPEGAAAILIAEGFATAASIHEATGCPVAVAFNAGNLEPVTKAMKKRFPALRMLICGDDDHHLEDNTGRTKAEAAALAHGCLLAFPVFGPDRGEKDTDFNDLHRLAGLETIRRCVMEPLSSLIEEDAGVTEISGVTEVTGVQASNGGLPAVTPTETPEVIEAQPATSSRDESPFPGEQDRPCYVVLDDWVEAGGTRHRPGVYWCGRKEAKNDIVLFDTWFCSPLHVEAVTFDGQQHNFGRLLRFKNSLGKWREWAMPMELLRGSGDELRGELLAMGVELDPFQARQQLPAYLQREHPKRRMHCALQVGWAGDSFVLPDRVIGPTASGVIFQSGERGHEEHTQAGTLAGWQAEIAGRAVGNPLMVLALSASFAGPLLAKCNADGGGIHPHGDSSTGKTTLLEAACSVWGGPNYKRSWRATANGMEGAAALFNDCLLALDEISECDPKEVGAIVYALGNGRGKQRATRSGTARGVTRWRCFIVSTGERTIATTMQEGGQRAKAGQGVRLLDIPVARAFGAFDTLHGMASGAALSDAIKRGAASHYGHAGRAFLEKLTRDERDFCAYLEQVKQQPELAAEHGEGQDKRAAARFALIGMAGELATEYGVTGWQAGEAIQAAAEGFRLWQSARGRGNDERRQIMERVSAFIERHGDGRFSDADNKVETSVRDRAGWWRDAGGERCYLFTAEAMREAVKGFEFTRALDVMQEAGALPAPGADGKRAKPYRINRRVVKLYPIHPDKLAGTQP